MVVNKYLVLLIAFVAADCFGQRTFVAEVQPAEATVKTIRMIEFDGFGLQSSETESGKVPIVVLTTDAPSPLVRAYEKTNPFPPKSLLRVGDGRYVLDGKPGSEWTIEILSIDNGQIWSKFLQAKIGNIPGGEDPPADPTDPVDPVKDYSSITKLVKESKQVKDDPGTAKKIYDAYASVLASTKATTVQQMAAEIGSARAEAIGGDDPLSNWYELFNAAGKLIEDNPPTTVAEYKAAITAFMEGLK